MVLSLNLLLGGKFNLLQELVSFVRKRDKRVQAHKVRRKLWAGFAIIQHGVPHNMQLLMEEREQLRQQRVAENRERHRKKRLQ